MDNRMSAMSSANQPPDLFQAVQCPDCDSDVTITELAPSIYNADVRHDDTCPWYSAFEARPPQ